MDILYNILSQIVSVIFFIGLVLLLIISALYFIYMGFFYDAEKELEKEKKRNIDRIIQELIDTNDERMARFKADVAEMEAQKAREALEKPKQGE